MEKNRVNYISFINVIATVSVVIMHANSSFWNYSKDSYWGVTNVIESVCFCAVPLFFMLSGATLIDYQKRYSTKEFFKKRFLKTVIPFLFWSIFGMFWASRKVFKAMADGVPGQKLNWTVTSVIDGILNTKFTQIYWFFIPLFCIYLVIPFFAAIPAKRRMKVYTYIIFVGLIFNFTVPLLLSMLKTYLNVSIVSTLTVFVSHQYLIYPLIGYVLHQQQLKLRYRLMIYAGALAGLLVFMIGTYVRTRHTGVLDGLYRGYYNLPCVLYSAGIFLLLKNLGQHIKRERINRFLTWFQSYTFPIYLIHRYYLDVFEENLKLVHIEKASITYVVCATVLAILLSLLTAMLLRKIPLLKRIVP